MKFDKLTEEWELTFHHLLQQEDRGQMTALNALKPGNGQDEVNAYGSGEIRGHLRRRSWRLSCGLIEMSSSQILSSQNRHRLITLPYGGASFALCALFVFSAAPQLILSTVYASHI